MWLWNLVKTVGQKWGNRENLIAAKNRFGMQEKHVVAIPEKGADPRGSYV